MTVVSSIPMTVGERMTRARLFSGYQQEDMADLLGRTRNTIGNWERGSNEPPFSAVAEWAQITRVSLEWIAYGDRAPAHGAPGSYTAAPIAHLSERPASRRGSEEAPSEDGASDTSHLRESNPRPIHYE